MAQPTSKKQQTPVNTDSMAQPTSENQETTLKTDSIPEPISVDQETSVNTGPKLPPTAENTNLKTVEWQQGGAGEGSEIELPDLNTGELLLLSLIKVGPRQKCLKEQIYPILACQKYPHHPF